MKNSLMITSIIIVLIGLSYLLVSCGEKSIHQLKVELLPDQGNPLVNFRILLKLGSANDPVGKEGLCTLALRMIAEGGSQEMSYQEINQKFYPMAASVRLSLGKEMSVFSSTIHIDNLKNFYAIFKEMLLNPGFREEDFIRLKSNQLNYLEKTLIGNDDEQFGKELLNLMMYENHPYGHTESGTVESVKSMTLDEVKSFYQEYFVQGNILVGLAGGYPSDFVDRIIQDFSILPEKETPPLELPPQRSPEGLEIYIVDKPTPATAISMGFPVPITKAHEDYFPLWIAVSHFGEHRQHLSHLFQKIREERGQNYGDYAYTDHFVQGRGKFPAPNYCRQQQYFSIWIRPVANSNRHFVVRQALRELKILIEEGISQERFELTRTYLLNYTRLYAQTLGERLGWQMDSHYYGYEDFLAEVQTRLPKISREQVNEAVRKYLDHSNIYIAIITEDAESFKNALISNSPSPIEYANPNMPEEILEEDLIIQVFPLGVQPEKVRIAKAVDFFKSKKLPAS
ncbi:MAG: insulinase family protein [Candidatus Aminicenantes bacterium]|nr:insulinase family protein [Candidatus Aminicenantes bacterium]